MESDKILVFILVLTLISLPLVSSSSDGVEIGTAETDESVGVIMKAITSVKSFLSLDDTPASYAGSANECLVVNAGATAVEFKACAGGGDFSFTDFQTSFDLNHSFQTIDLSSTGDFNSSEFQTSFNLNFSAKDGVFNSSSWNRLGTNVILANIGDNVGIGTATPSTKVEVVKNGATGVYVKSGSAGGFTRYTLGRTSEEISFAVVGGANQFFTGSVAGDAIIRTDSTASKVLLGVGNAIPPAISIENQEVGFFMTEPTLGAVEIRKSGGVGLAVSSGNAGTFTAIGVGRTAIDFFLGVVGVTDQFFDGTASGDAVIRQEDSSQKLHFGVGGIGMAELIIVDGKVGIGTPTPTHELNVVGDINATGDVIAEDDVIAFDDLDFGGIISKDGLELIDFDVTGGSIMIGENAGTLPTEYGNVFIGKDAGKFAGLGADRNVIVGYLAGSGADYNASANVIIGPSSGIAITTGGNNVLIGNRAGYTTASTSGNNYIGYEAGRWNNGFGNSFIGYQADKFAGVSGTTGSIALGRNAKVQSSFQFIVGGDEAGYYIDEVYIGKGYNSTTPTDVYFTTTRATGVVGKNLIFSGGVSSSTTNGSVILAHDGTSPVGMVGIGTATPTHELNVVGTINASSILAMDGFSGTCVNATYVSGIATGCND